MPPTTQTFENHRGSALPPDVTTRSTTIAFGLGLGHVVQTRFANLIAEGRDPASILVGLGATIQGLDRNPLIPEVTEYEDRMLSLVDRITLELNYKDELPDGEEAMRLLRGALYLSHILGTRDSERYNANRREVRDAVRPLVGKLALGILATPEQGKLLSSADIQAVVEFGVDDDVRPLVLARLLDYDMMPEAIQRSLHIHPEDLQRPSWGRELFNQPSAEVPEGGPSGDNPHQQFGGTALLNPGEMTVEPLFDTSSLFNSKNLDALRDALKAHPQRAMFPKTLIEIFNQIVAARVLDPEISFEESLEYFQSLRPTPEVENHDEGQVGLDRAMDADEESATYERLTIELDNKLLSRGFDLLFSDEPGKRQELGSLLSEHRLLSTDTSEGFRVREDQYLMLAQGYLSDALPQDVIGGDESKPVTDTGVVAQLAINDALRAENAKMIEQNRKAFLEELSKISFDAKSILVLTEVHPLKQKYFELVGDDGTGGAEFLLACLEKVSSYRDPREAYAFAQIADCIDDERLKQRVIALHDAELLRYVARLKKGGTQYDREIVVLLSRDVRFLGEDDSKTVVWAREIFDEAVSRLTNNSSTGVTE